MNRLFAFIVAFFLLYSCKAQSGRGMEAFYDHYGKNAAATQMGIPRFLLRMGADDPELRKALKYMHSLRVFILEQTGKASAGLRHDLKRALQHDGFESVLQVSEEKERIGIYIVEEADKVRRILLAVEDDGELVVLQARTHFSMDQLGDFLSDVRSGGGRKGLNSLYSLNK